jgi:hypothetical protein
MYRCITNQYVSYISLGSLFFQFAQVASTMDEIDHLRSRHKNHNVEIFPFLPQYLFIKQC